MLELRHSALARPSRGRNPPRRREGLKGREGREATGLRYGPAPAPLFPRYRPLFAHRQTLV